MTPITAQRIMIFGKPGAGKSTFALKLHQKLGIPLYHLDAYFFTHYWTKRNYEEFMAIQHDLVTQDFWIIDGNCTRSLETRYQKADVCIYFNFSRSHCLRGIVKRFFSKDQSIKDRAEHCYEKITWQLIAYLWTFEIRVHDTIANLQEKYPQVTFIEVKTQHDVQRLLMRISKK